MNNDNKKNEPVHEKNEEEQEDDNENGELYVNEENVYDDSEKGNNTHPVEDVQFVNVVKVYESVT